MTGTQADRTRASNASMAARLRRMFGRTAPKGGKRMDTKDLFTDSLLGNGLRSYMVMPGQPVWMDRNYPQFAIEAYVRNVIAHRAMGMVSGAASSAKVKLYTTKGIKRELKSHPLLDMLKQPNPAQAMGEFFQALYQYKMISGNAFVQAVGPQGAVPTELYLLRPDRMAVIAGKGTVPAGYRYTVGNASTDFPVDRITGRSMILHLKNFHPLNDWYGLSPVEAAAYSIDQHNQSGAWNQALLQNGARPSGALVVRADAAGGGVLSESQYNRVRAQMDEQFSGAGNAGRPLLLEGGLDWKEMSLSPKDMDFIEAKNSAARDIALAFGVPPQMLGIPGDNTYSNLQEARLALWEQTVVPLVHITMDALNRWLAPMFGGELELCADTDGISALAVRNQAIWDRVEKASFLTNDEKRAAVGYGPLASAVKKKRSRVSRKIRGRKDTDFDAGDDDDGGGGGDGSFESNLAAALRRITGNNDNGSADNEAYYDDEGSAEDSGDRGNGGRSGGGNSGYGSPVYQGAPDEPIEPVYPIEDALAGLTAGEAMAALRGMGALGEEAAALGDDALSSDRISNAMQSLEDYFGGPPEDVFPNKDGDIIMMNGEDKIRFDINNPGNDDPHFHIQELDENGKWVDAGDEHRYYFKNGE